MNKARNLGLVAKEANFQELSRWHVVCFIRMKTRSNLHEKQMSFLLIEVAQNKIHECLQRDTVSCKTSETDL